MSKELEEELTHAQWELQAAKDETVELPSDIMQWYACGRPEMLKMVQRPLSDEETIAVMDAMAGLMTIKQLQDRVISLMEEQRASLHEQIEQVLHAVRSLSS